MTKRRSKADLTEAAEMMQKVADYFPAEEDSRKDAAMRRRVEGAIVATELAAGEDSPRTPQSPPKQ